MRFSLAAHCAVTLISWTILLSAEVRASDAEMAVCAAMENSAARLACFDGLASERNATSRQVQSEEKGDWNVRFETSRIDDSKNVYLTLQSSDTFRDRFGNAKKAYLVIACQDHSTEFAVQFEASVMSDSGDYGQLTYRIDGKPAQTAQFSVSADNWALGLWSGRGIPMIKKLFGSQTFLVRAVPYMEGAITVQFKTTGLESAIKPLRKACFW